MKDHFLFLKNIDSKMYNYPTELKKSHFLQIFKK